MYEIRLLLSRCENKKRQLCLEWQTCVSKRKSGLTLDQALDICHAAEANKVQMKVMETENQQSHDVNFLRKNKLVNRGKSYIQGSKPPDGSTVAHKQHIHCFTKAVTVDIVAAIISHASVRYMAHYVRNVKARTTERKCAEVENIRRKNIKLRQSMLTTIMIASTISLWESS